MNTAKPESVDAYIAGFPAGTQKMLKKMRALISKAAPDAVEKISYGMPGYTYRKKPLVYFAGYQGHIGLYALPVAHAAFTKDFAMYKTGKGSVQFPLDQPLPEALILKIIAFNKAQILQAEKTKKGAK